MQKWLGTVSLELLHSESLSPEKKLCSALTILCCLYLVRNRQYVRDVNEEVQLSLLRVVALSPSGAKDFQYLMGMMQREESKSVGLTCFENNYVSLVSNPTFLYRKLAVDSLTHLFTSVVKRRKHNYTIHLLQALPLIHFLRTDSVPNETAVLNLKGAMWNDRLLNFEAVHSMMDHETGYVNYL